MATLASTVPTLAAVRSILHGQKSLKGYVTHKLKFLMSGFRIKCMCLVSAEHEEFAPMDGCVTSHDLRLGHSIVTVRLYGGWRYPLTAM